MLIPELVTLALLPALSVAVPVVDWPPSSALSATGAAQLATPEPWLPLLAFLGSLPVGGAWPIVGDAPVLFSEQGKLILLDRGQAAVGGRAQVSKLAFTFAPGDRPRGLVQSAV